MASGQRSTWPFVLLLGLFASLLVGTAAAVAAPSDGAQPWWHDEEPQRVTGTLVAVDGSEGTAVLDELLTYQPQPTGTLGPLEVRIADLGDPRVGETYDVVVTRHDGTWTAPELLPLDTD